MTANNEGRCLKHDTTMCGDPKVWFPMRVTYSRELKVKAELVGMNTENPRRELVPAVNNLIYDRA